MENNLRKIQLVQLDILNKVVQICNEHNIQYYLIGGTLIGAVRHKGFIPWDDDIDIAIKRKDYERFIKIAKNELQKPYKLCHYTIDKKYKFYLLNVTNTSVSVTIDRVNPIVSNVWIDILPIDGIPSGFFKQNIYKFRILYYRALSGFANIDNIRNIKRNFVEKILIYFAKIFKIGKIINLEKIRIKNDNFVKKYDFDNCNYVGTIFGNYGFHEIVPKNYFGTGKTVIFENQKFNAPEKIHQYLTHIYGNYMELPPEEKRNGHHILKIETDGCNNK